MLSLMTLLLAAAAGDRSTPIAIRALPVAQSKSARSMIRLHQQGRSAPAARIEDIGWLEGTWVGRMPKGAVEHVILSPRAGQMPSFVRALSGQGVWFYEISVFAEDSGTLVSRVKHFTPELAGWEARDAFVERRLVERDDANLYFDGLTISRAGPDDFVVYFLERENGREGQTLVLPFKRVRRS